MLASIVIHFFRRGEMTAHVVRADHWAWAIERTAWHIIDNADDAQCVQAWTLRDGQRDPVNVTDEVQAAVEAEIDDRLEATGFGGRV